MKIINCAQGDAVWHSIRLGRLTASNVKLALSFGKENQPLKVRSDYMMKLLCERLTGNTSRNVVTEEMERGNAEEKYAREAYAVRNNVEVTIYGIAIHRDFDWYAASPDGIVNVTGGAEFKNPTTLKHLTWKLAGILPEEHLLQCHSLIDVWELDFLDFFSYDSRLPAHLAEFQAPRLWRDDTKIAHMHEGLKSFNQELEDWIGVLNEKWPAPTPEELAAILGEPDMEGLGLGGAELNDECFGAANVCAEMEAQ